MAACLGFTLAGCSTHQSDEVTLVTEQGLGPDKWATAWLLSRQIMPGARLQVVPVGAKLPEGVRFDVDGSDLRRRGELSAFEVVRGRYELDDPLLTKFGRIVQEIEVEFWKPAELVESQAVEQGFRSLQRTYGREGVSPDCYLAFFDKVYESLKTNEEGVSMRAQDLAVDCGAVDLAAAKRNQLIPELPIEHVLREMQRGKRVVFVDVREPDEFAEGHIPGALNLSIRDVGGHIVDHLGPADYVVSYCIKDFRGFEMAKALHDAGVSNSVILKPFGVQGWVQAGLPVVGSRGLPPEAAEQRLKDCIRDVGACLASNGKE